MCVARFDEETGVGGRSYDFCVCRFRTSDGALISSQKKDLASSEVRIFLQGCNIKIY